MFPWLARLLASDVFRDYSTIEELLRVVPSVQEALILEWKDELLEAPFFRNPSTGGIETADAYSKRLRALGLRAGYATPPRGHDIRAEGLYLMSMYKSG